MCIRDRRNTWATYCCRKPIPQTCSKENIRKTMEKLPNTTSRITIRLLYQGKCSSQHRRNWPGGTARNRPHRKRQRRTADGSPANTLYRKEWFAETAAAITGESPGIFMGGNRWSGGVLAGWNLENGTAEIPDVYKRQVMVSMARILRPSRPMMRPFISSLGKGTTEMVASAT